jgi:hypothetical protein
MAFHVINPSLPKIQKSILASLCIKDHAVKQLNNRFNVSWTEEKLREALEYARKVQSRSSYSGDEYHLRVNGNVARIVIASEFSNAKHKFALLTITCL